MPIDRIRWKLIRITESHDPDLPCPRCGDILKLLSETLRIENDGMTSRCQSDPNWEPDFRTGSCTSMFRCRTEKCSETVSMCGHSSVDNIDYENGNCDNVLHPTYFHPALHLFRVSSACPDIVTNEIVAGFSLFWCDKPGTLNHFRKAIELLLDVLRVRKYRVVTEKGKNHRRPLSLHHRINEFKKCDSILGSQLEAVKWIGNSGSHSDDVDDEDVFDACDLLEHFIHERLERRGTHIRKITATINRSKKPRSHKKEKLKPQF